MEHAGVKQTSGAASLAAGARIGSGLIGQLAPAPAPATIGVLMLNNHFLHSTHREDSSSTRVWHKYTNTNTGDSAGVERCDRKWKCVKMKMECENNRASGLLDRK